MEESLGGGVGTCSVKGKEREMVKRESMNRLEMLWQQMDSLV